MSADGSNVSVSLAESFVELASVTPVGAAMSAVLVIVPVADGSIVTVTLNVAVSPTGTSTLSEIAPVPAAAQSAPPVAVQVQLMLVAPAGSASVTVAPTTSDGPALLTTMV